VDLTIGRLVMQATSRLLGLEGGALILVLAGVGMAAEDPPDAPAKPGTMIVLGQGWANPALAPSLGYAWDRKAENPPLLFSRRSALVGDLHALAVSRDGRQFYLCRNRFAIVRADKVGETTFFTHTTYVRDLALDDEDNVYFSEATGAGGDGKLYRVVPAAGAAKTDLVYTVRLADVGYWAGNFAFGRTAGGGLDTDALYLSSGNRVPASVYRVTRKAGAWGKPEELFSAPTPISGLVLTGPREAYFVSGNRVYRLADLRKAEAVLTLPGVARLEGLTVVPAKDGGKKKD
jgi:hypothetical protein